MYKGIKFSSPSIWLLDPLHNFSIRMVSSPCLFFSPVTISNPFSFKLGMIPLFNLRRQLAPSFLATNCFSLILVLFDLIMSDNSL